MSHYQQALGALQANYRWQEAMNTSPYNDQYARASLIAQSRAMARQWQEELQTSMYSQLRFTPRWQGKSYGAKSEPVVPTLPPAAHGLDIDACKPPLRDR